MNQELSLIVNEGGTSQKVALSTTSAQSAAINADFVVVTLTAAGFVRGGADPTAVSDGTDQYLPANVPMRLNIKPGWKLAFILASGTGDAYITPRA